MNSILKIQLLGICLFFASFSLFGEEKMAQEFGSSVKISKDSPQVTLAQLKGKAVLLVFFQSWCPKCNKWSGKMFKDIEKAHGNNPNVILFAIKTDGGGTSGAESYLKERNLNFKKWIVASDKSATYYKLLTGEDKLFKGVEVSPNGSYKIISGHSMIGRNYASIYGDQLKRILPDKKYRPELSNAVRNTELSAFKNALLECIKLSRDKKVKEDAKALKKDILEAASAKVKRLLLVLKDESSKERFSAFLTLRGLAIELKGTEPSKEAIKGLKEARSAPFMKKELKAEKVYMSIIKKASKMKRRKREEALRATLPKFAEKYSDTYYGRLAGKK